jgi:hypothetical protein
LRHGSQIQPKGYSTTDQTTVQTRFVGIAHRLMSVVVQVFGRRYDGLTTDCGGRRPKSAKARSRGKLGTGGATGAMGI